ncbi:hypothetical protein [Nitrosopumilus maritimus]|uniref:Uncharacterized protein n=1 Tax=Nitrosopumilus maritimus (strain SCM1) TaxID=436308 RepID=A9A3X4_NITMS|nr:hypothetical protein [Nitrosopumilus maritimus]ABX13674.1 hypothetical protein Nmar_1778 [Nitrosopumilus maritimus SCM1]
MFIKLGIIAGIIVLGGMIFSNEIDSFFPTTSATITDSLTNDISNIGTKATNAVENRIDESIDKIVDKTSDAITNEIHETGDKISNEVSDVKETSQNIIHEKVSNFNPVESIQNLFTGSSSNKQKSSNEISTLNPPSSSSQVITNSSPLVYETLSLSTKQMSDENIILQYSDSSGKTNSVNVILRSEQEEIFSGTFFSSNFETTVNDAAGIPYFIDMIVEHEEYGTVTSSVFNPGDSSDSNISGIFS